MRKYLNLFCLLVSFTYTVPAVALDWVYTSSHRAPASERLQVENWFSSFESNFKKMKEKNKVYGPDKAAPLLEAFRKNKDLQEFKKRITASTKLPSLGRCGKNCFTVSQQGIKAEIVWQKTLGGVFYINEKRYEVDFRKADFSKVLSDIEEQLKSEQQLKLSSTKSIFDYIIPSAHAGALKTGIIVAAVAAIIGAIVWFVGSQLLNQADDVADKARDVVNEAETAANETIDHASEEAEARINQATDAADQANSDLSENLDRAENIQDGLNATVGEAQGVADQLNNAAENLNEAAGRIPAGTTGLPIPAGP